MAQKIIERVETHYESSEVPFGKIYEWHNAYIALECDCGEKVTLTATSTVTTCSRCGADKPLCRISSPTPGSTTPKSGQTNTGGTRPLILKARPGVTTILRVGHDAKNIRTEAILRG